LFINKTFPFSSNLLSSQQLVPPLQIMIVKFYMLLICLASASISYANVVSTSGNIRFEVSSNGIAEMTLNNNGLAIGSETSQANLSVTGNAIISSLSVGGSDSSGSNLYVSGSTAFSHEVYSSNTELNTHTINLLDSSASNMIVHLPVANVVAGQLVNIKKITSEHDIWISGHGSAIDLSQEIILTSGEMGSVSTVSNGEQWFIIESSGVESTVASENLVLWLPLDEVDGDVITNYGGNALSVSRSNFETSGNGWVQGVSGNAMAFDGEDDKITISHDESLTSDELTVSLWVQFDRLPSDFGPTDIWFLRKSNSSSPFQTYYFSLSTTGLPTFKVVDSGNSYKTADSNAAAETGVWYHFVGTFSDRVRFYLDGELKGDASSGTGSIQSSDSILTIGYNTVDHRFKGTIDDVRIYNRALTAEQIFFLSQSGRR
jgi:hypothetical protein